ncbi:adenylate synthase [Herbiconiux sp. VKM Ac-1786]|uniref:F390 synthetase-related protein n=1 Tax=Herbiconiux sp. VKM Ac-1786 TaxID=2783824 RepID=UPI00188D5FD4|nr:F390 synthetase-related protein [Herbiconiux sp. VKM Ac-1786]MBF4573951.1 adenylate synthase [Herbiconiux sp. VKM Ac-1786]
MGGSTGGSTGGSAGGSAGRSTGGSAAGSTGRSTGGSIRGRARGTANQSLLRALLVARFVRARWGYRFPSRHRFEVWQRRRMRAFVRRARRAPYWAGRRARDFPVTDKTALLEHFDAMNTRGVRLTEALAAAQAAERSRDFTPTVAGDLTVGLSSGTSGRRGAFLVSPRERMLWAGTVLARVLDRAAVAQLLQPWRPPVTIAFFLRAGGGLYESVASSRVRFAYYDLTEPFEALVQRLAGAGRVTVLVGPASVLDALAQASATAGIAAPRLVVSVAEVLEPETAERIEAAWGVRPRQVYQATEGLLALPCDAGALHLAEETVRFDREWLDAGRTRFVPVVTDLERRTQIIARYRLDDVLRVDPAAPERCACGRVTTVLAGVDGRADAVLRLPAVDGSRLVEVFPDVLRRAFALESAAFADWRVTQRGTTVHVALDVPAAGSTADGPGRAPGDSAREAVDRALGEVFDTAGCSATIEHDPWTPRDPAVKLRRIVRESP